MKTKFDLKVNVTHINIDTTNEISSMNYDNVHYFVHCCTMCICPLLYNVHLSTAIQCAFVHCYTMCICPLLYNVHLFTAIQCALFCPLLYNVHYFVHYYNDLVVPDMSTVTNLLAKKVL